MAPYLSIVFFFHKDDQEVKVWLHLKKKNLVFKENNDGIKDYEDGGLPAIDFDYIN